MNLDQAWIHQDHNCPALKEMLADHPEVKMDYAGCQLPPTIPGGNDANNAILRAVSSDPAVSVRALCKQYGIELARDYIVRSRRGLNGLRQYGAPIPSAGARRGEPHAE